MHIAKYLFCANKAEMQGDSLILNAEASPYILAKVWQFANDIPDSFINSSAATVKVPGYKVYLRYYSALEQHDPETDSSLLVGLAEMADYFLKNKIQLNEGAYRRYKE